ncbi:MAG: 3-deoxy-D-manno-octulosonic acid transferase [Candidatus Mcinerneyibacterium aminivorans]|uniref:3-deoxy-D-manno-octulosonic acid transferase n=1 Tax=Candidatus Mcinerneyibacterium aminivorans TaxID=2703815 RepID=A0A5D0MK95_9BACT|nr:MAG: 3-deoxy-D-manno-octulosonic acid transferase [Candidatus Mcinerneyibacterium aminivorans]
MLKEKQRNIGIKPDMFSLFFIIYNVLILIVIFILFPYFFIRAYITGKDKHGLYQRIGFIPKKILKNKNVLWFHCVSAGEAKVAVPVIERLLDDHKITISVGTETGYRMIKEHFQDEVDLFYMPVDFIIPLNRIFKILKPKALIIVETEIWPQLIRLAYLKDIPTILINGRMPPKDYKTYKRFGFLFKHIFSMYDELLVTSEKEKQHFMNCGAKKEKIEVFGNIKFDVYDPEGSDDKRIQKIKRFFKSGNKKKNIVVGSTHPNEEKIILKQLKKLKDEVSIILAPRHIDRIDEIVEVLKGLNLSYSKRSSGQLDWDKNVILWDTMGELDVLYKFADIVLVGGSWIDQGGHNIIEPAIWEKPIIVGPYMYNFQEIYDYFRSKDAIIEAQKDNIYEKVSLLLNNRKIRMEFSSNAKKCILENKGAVKKYKEVIKKYLE